MVGSSVFATAALTSGYGESLVDEGMNKKEERNEGGVPTGLG
jgi:hypothetical protein